MRNTHRSSFSARQPIALVAENSTKAASSPQTTSTLRSGRRKSLDLSATTNAAMDTTSNLPADATPKASQADTAGSHVERVTLESNVFKTAPENAPKDVNFDDVLPVDSATLQQVSVPSTVVPDGTQSAPQGTKPLALHLPPPLSSPPQEEPGSGGGMSSGGLHLLSEAIFTATGQSPAKEGEPSGAPNPFEKSFQRIVRHKETPGSILSDDLLSVARPGETGSGSGTTPSQGLQVFATSNPPSLGYGTPFKEFGSYFDLPLPTPNSGGGGGQLSSYSGQKALFTASRLLYSGGDGRNPTGWTPFLYPGGAANQGLQTATNAPGSEQIAIGAGQSTGLTPFLFPNGTVGNLSWQTATPGGQGSPFGQQLQLDSDFTLRTPGPMSGTEAAKMLEEQYHLCRL